MFDFADLATDPPEPFHGDDCDCSDCEPYEPEDDIDVNDTGSQR